MRVSIHSIQKTLFEGNAAKLICRTPQGEITVLDNHIPLITKITGPAAIAIDREEEKYEIPLVGGILEVRPGSDVVILANQ